jgi:TonB family protein
MAAAPARIALAVALAVGLVFAIAAPGPAAAQESGARREDRPAAPASRPALTRPPELLEAAAPVYPPEAESAGLTADVPVVIHIAADGSVAKVDVTAPQGHGFDEAATAAVMKYRFRPAEFGGQPGPISVSTTIHFRLDQEPATQPGPESAPASAPAAPASARLRGVVKERGTRRKLAGVTIALQPADPSADASGAAPADTASGPDGGFAAEAPAGKYRLVALSSGYDRFEERLELQPGEETEVTVYLRPQGGSPYEAVVEGDRDQTEVTRRPLSRHELTTVPGTFGDPVRVVLSLPGLARSPFSTGLLLIRGSDPNQSAVYLDGHQVPLLFHFFGGPSILNPEFLEGLNLYPGGFPVRFGGAIGGIVAVDTRPSASDGVHGAAKIDFIDSGVYLRAPLGDSVTVAAAGRRSYIDAFLPMFLPNDTQVTPVYYDYQARVDVKLPHQARLSITGLGSDDHLAFNQIDTDTARSFGLDQHTGFNRLIASFVTPISGGLTLTVSPSLGRDDLFFATSGGFNLHVVNVVADVRERVVGELAKGLHLDTGLDLHDEQTSVEQQLPISTSTVNPLGSLQDVPTQSVERGGNRYQLGAYAELAWDVVSRLKLVPGVRADAYLVSGNTHFSVDPRLVVRWQALPRTAFKGYTGLFHQAPALQQTDNLFGNPRLDLEQAIHYGLGVEQRIGRHITAETEVYYVDRQDLPVPTRDVVRTDDGSVIPERLNNDGVGHTIGLEVMLRHEITRNFYAWLSYTLSRTVIRQHPGDIERLDPFDETHNLIAVASYRTNGGWELGARVQYTTGRRQNDVLGGTFISDQNRYMQLQGTDQVHMPDFFQLDLRAEKTWTYRTWSLGAYLDVLNATNRANPEAIQYDYRFRQSSAITGLPIVPTLGVEGHW